MVKCMLCHVDKNKVTPRDKRPFLPFSCNAPLTPSESTRGNASYSCMCTASYTLCTYASLYLADGITQQIYCDTRDNLWSTQIEIFCMLWIKPY